MKSKMKGVILIVALAVLMATSACSAQWVNVALADMPMLAQMALNIVSLSATMQGRPLNPADAVAIQNISTEASKDMGLLQTLYNEYKANPTDAGLQKIGAAITTVQQNLPALLASAHISDAVLAQRVTAGVNLILTTVESFAALMPNAGSGNVHAQIEKKAIAVPSSASLRQQWNDAVCAEAACRMN
jgi:hypothetical protein